MLTISSLTYRIAGRTIFDEANLSLLPGWKVGIIGANGTGKSTLLKLVMGELLSDGGTIEFATGLSVGMVRQDMEEGEISLLDVVLKSNKEYFDLMAASETETDPYKISEIHERLIDIDAYTAPARASAILSGLGFKEEDLSQPISSFSGGWRMRVALAGALFQAPDVLLLDEPTNHLDLEAIMWLETYLMNYPHTVLLISHDRDLLNKCTDHIVSVENKRLELYTGNYNTFEKERAERRGLQQKMHEKQMQQRAHLQKFVDRFKAKASKAKQAQSRVKALEKMDIVDAVIADRATTFHFPQPEELAPPLMTLRQADIGYDGVPVLNKVDQRIDMDDRIALLGANGNGKSTLIKFISGRLKALHGELEHTSKLRIGYFSQHQTDEFDVESTAYFEMKRLLPGIEESVVRGKLGRFGFNKQLSDSKIKTLSGGEKARLLFAMISYNAPHMLLLDEPTNHLDIEAREGLVQALNTYDGAVVIVSHDPSMVERVADRLWLIKDGECQVYDGDIDTYRKLVLDDQRQERRSKRKAKDAANGKENNAENKQKKKDCASLEKKVKHAEKEMQKLNGKKDAMEEMMAEPAFYDDKDNAQQVQFSYNQLVKKIERTEQRWEEAQQAYDSAMNS